MGGKDFFHTSRQTVIPPDEYDGGTVKWSKTLPNGAVACTGVALGPRDAYSREYRFYVGANDDKVYCYQVSRSGNSFSVGANPVWTYTCDGDPVGTPVLGSSDGVSMVFVSDSAGTVHAIRQSDGAKVWKSSGHGQITAPLKINRLYIGQKNGSEGNLLAFEAYYEYDNQGPEWIWETYGPVISTPAQAAGPFGMGILAELYFTTENGYLVALRDTGSATERWHWSPTSAGHACKTWPMLADGAHIYVTTYQTSNDLGHVWAFEGDGDRRWDYPVTQGRTSTWPVQYKNIGRIEAHSCTDSGTNPNIWVLCKDAGSGTGKPTSFRVLDNSPGTASGTGYVLNTMDSDSDELTSTPVLGVHYLTYAKYVHFVTTTGKWYVIDGGTGALLQYWPKTLNETIPKHDLALDEEGALIFITADGDVKAYWPPPYELLEP